MSQEINSSKINWLKIENNRDYFSSLLELKNSELALRVVEDADHFIECEGYIIIALDHPYISKKILNATLKAFLDLYPNQKGKHMEWVHSLTHFTEVLWRRHMDRWIKHYYKKAFEGAREFNEAEGCDQLVYNFVFLSRWFDNPIDFFLTPENLNLIGWDNFGQQFRDYIQARLRSSPFHSEISFLKWQFEHPIAFSKWDDLSQRFIFNYQDTYSLIKRFSREGTQAKKLWTKHRQLLLTQVSELFQALQDSTDDWRRKRIAQSIQMIIVFLADISYQSDKIPKHT